MPASAPEPIQISIHLGPDGAQDPTIGDLDAVRGQPVHRHLRAELFRLWQVMARYPPDDAESAPAAVAQPRAPRPAPAGAPPPKPEDQRQRPQQETLRMAITARS